MRVKCSKCEREADQYCIEPDSQRLVDPNWDTWDRPIPHSEKCDGVMEPAE